MQRQTKQRDAISGVFEKAKRPLTTDEVLGRAQRKVPSLGIATVYRTLNTLVENAELALVEIPGQAPRYERADLQHHHHFYCTRCDKVFELEGCPGPLTQLTPKGFTVERHDITLYGTCDTCHK